jgi:pyridoxamine 5'-phosphate oxidase
MNNSTESLCEEYRRAALDISTVSADPFRQFDTWLQQALEVEVLEPHAMALATATAQGVPSCRIVLLRGISQGGFVFHTNYDSRKGAELAVNPHATLLFFWAELERQVRIEGTVQRITESESDVYFAMRPRGSQLGAWASPQSAVIRDRKELEQRLRVMTARFPGLVERPSNWGGFRLLPRTLEFWQGRVNRLHDRLRYGTEGDGRWRIERLAP